ncbi:polysaccharide deacetylase family protein [Paraburkholderia rhizosphaerae]|uniref:Polysaccharide deacetylase n=1 Tax=Paraburkholderia rhizosphaerae TaxID=480658 RepID=A0A4R8LW67_9BURK|nr:polysaccharide deacetylase family protein [Paraburkholderia rhizosphaerae]TDY52004.1 polysaccharide deacetylase [Paraburkholderia rhizosphaerae]
MTRVALAVPVLMYHHVSPTPGMITVSPAHFAEQIACLARRGYRTLNARELADYLRGAPVAPKSVVITFDDGYLDNWVHAHPVLQRYGFSAICFLVSAWPGDGPARPHASSGGCGKLPYLLSHAESEDAIAKGRADDAILRWSEIEAMRRCGTFEFHSHTHCHARWDMVTRNRGEKRERLHDDLVRARDTLRSRLGEVSNHLCWPQGYYDDDYLDVALSAGFRHFYTCDRGTNSFRRWSASQPLTPAFPGHSIRRLEVRDRSAAWLASRLWVHARPLVSRAYLAIKR